MTSPLSDAASPRARMRRAFRVEVLEPDRSAGARLAVMVAVPLVALLLADQADAALLATLGALNTGLGDAGGPYALRIRSTTIAAGLTTVGFAAGVALAGQPVVAVLALTAWVFLMGFAPAFGSPGATIGFVGAVVPIIALGLPADPSAWLVRSGWYLAGSLWAVVVTTVLWPLRPQAPMRSALAEGYRLVAGFVDGIPHDEEHRSRAREALATAVETAREATVRTGRSRQGPSTEGVAALAALEKLELGLGALDRSCAELASLPPEIASALSTLGETCARVARRIQHGRGWAAGELEQQLRRLDAAELEGSGRVAADALVITAADLASGPVSGAAGLDRPAPADARPSPRSLLHPDSLVFRHALRLAVVVGVAQAVAFAGPFERSYWIPLTVVVVLKPSLGSVMEHGLQRLIGTILGVGVAFTYANLFDDSQWAVVAGIVALAWVTAAVMQLNYGLAVIAITPLVILLLSLSGSTIALGMDRLVDTAVGAVLALAGGLWLWPALERETLGATLARATEAEAAYLDRSLDERRPPSAVRAAHRVAERARSEAEAAVQRMFSEPRSRWVAPAAVMAFRDRLQALVESTTGLRVSSRATARRSGADGAPWARLRRDVAEARDRLAAAQAVLVDGRADVPTAPAIPAPPDHAGSLAARIDRDATALERAARTIADAGA